MADNIYLVGMMGSGKTAVAKLLSKRLRHAVIDLDDRIVAAQGMSINDIFASKGEPHFRDLEHAELRKVSFAEKTVVATGGGIVINDENIAVMRDSGVIIYLQASVDALLAHIKNDASRPLLKCDDPKTKLEEIFAQRKAQYEKADIIIETKDLNLEGIVAKIFPQLKPEEI